MKKKIVYVIRKIAKKMYLRYKKQNLSPKEQSHTKTDINTSRETTKESPPPTKSEIQIDVSFTPNPNACKFDASQKVTTESFSYSRQSPPTEHPLAHDLLSIDGVSSVFGVYNFITATKFAQAEWEDITPKIIDVIHKHLS